MYIPMYAMLKYPYIYIYIYTLYVMLLKYPVRGASDRMRPISVLRFWISKGLTQT